MLTVLTQNSRSSNGKEIAAASASVEFAVPLRRVHPRVVHRVGGKLVEMVDPVSDISAQERGDQRVRRPLVVDAWRTFCSVPPDSDTRGGSLACGAAPQACSCWSLLRQVGGLCVSHCSVRQHTYGSSRIP